MAVGLDLRGKTDELIRLKHGFQIADERLRGRKLPRVLKIREGGKPSRSFEPWREWYGR